MRPAIGASIMHVPIIFPLRTVLKWIISPNNRAYLTFSMERDEESFYVVLEIPQYENRDVLITSNRWALRVNILHYVCLKQHSGTRQEWKGTYCSSTR